MSTWACSCMLHSLRSQRFGVWHTEGGNSFRFGPKQRRVSLVTPNCRKPRIEGCVCVCWGGDNLQSECAATEGGLSKVVEMGRPVYLPVIDGRCRVQSQERWCYPRSSSGSSTAPFSLRLFAVARQKQPLHLKCSFIWLSGASSIIRILGGVLIT